MAYNEAYIKFYEYLTEIEAKELLKKTAHILREYKKSTGEPYTGDDKMQDLHILYAETMEGIASRVATLTTDGLDPEASK